MRDAGFVDVEVLGLHHGPRLRALDVRHGGSIVDAQVAVAAAGVERPEALLRDVASVTCDDFHLRAGDVDVSLDLLLQAPTPQ